MARHGAIGPTFIKEHRPDDGLRFDDFGRVVELFDEDLRSFFLELLCNVAGVDLFRADEVKSLDPRTLGDDISDDFAALTIGHFESQVVEKAQSP